MLTPPNPASSGRRVAEQFRRYDCPITPYDLRPPGRAHDPHRRPCLTLWRPGMMGHLVNRFNPHLPTTGSHRREPSNRRVDAALGQRGVPWSHGQSANAGPFPVENSMAGPNMMMDSDRRWTPIARPAELPGPGGGTGTPRAGCEGYRRRMTPPRSAAAAAVGGRKSLSRGFVLCSPAMAKGKTTAALGLVFAHPRHGERVGRRPKFIRRLSRRGPKSLEIFGDAPGLVSRLGEGFTWETQTGDQGPGISPGGLAAVRCLPLAE